MTPDLIKRVWEHREGVVEGFTKEYGVKQIKKWNRAWKINLIQKENPYWRDLYETFSA